MKQGIGSIQVIERDQHCPFCGKEKGLILSKVKKTSTSLLLPPAYGRKLFLTLIFSPFYAFIKGLKIIEKESIIEYTTYGFCPECGNTYSAAAPVEIENENEEPKLYKIKNKKMITGLCAGIADYTGLSLTWVRIQMVICSVLIIPALAYFLASALIPAIEDIERKEEKHEQ